jgi:hypothetical protein
VVKREAGGAKEEIYIQNGELRFEIFMQPN